MALDFGRYLQSVSPDRNSPTRGDLIDNFVLEACRRNRRPSPRQGRNQSPRDLNPSSLHRNPSPRGRGRKREKDSYNSSMKASFGIVAIEVSSKSDSCLPSCTGVEKISVRERKRSVSFADENGHDLATYCWIPTRGQRDYFDCFDDDDFDVDFDVPAFNETVFSLPYSPRPFCSPLTSPPSSPSSSSDDDGDFFSPIKWEPQNVFPERKVELNNVVCSLCFEQPGSRFDEFMKTLDADLVCLENVRVEDTTIFCSIKVKNVGFEKSVFVRCSYDNWLSYVDIPASHVPSGCVAPVHDTFSTTIYSPPSSTLSRKGPRTAELAIGYHVNGREHWDNNNGKNYRIVWRSPST